jgi:hypothetical protein
MKIILLIVGIIVVLFFLKSCFPSNNSKTNIKPKNIEIPSKKIQNDKIVLIENVKLDDVKKVIQDFCNIYNQEKVKALPLLTVLSNNKFAVTFPYDIDFITFCFIVNYLNYPTDILNYKPTINAWTTTKQQDEWMTNEIVNKKIMLFIPSDDKDYDNVYLTSSDNSGYKMGFAMGEEKQKLDFPKQNYIEPIEFEELKNKTAIQFK